MKMRLLFGKAIDVCVKHKTSRRSMKSFATRSEDSMLTNQRVGKCQGDGAQPECPCSYTVIAMEDV